MSDGKDLGLPGRRRHYRDGFAKTLHHLEKHLALVQIAKSVSWRSSHRCVWKGRSASLANFFGTFALPPGRGGSKILSVVGTTT